MSIKGFLWYFLIVLLIASGSVSFLIPVTLSFLFLPVSFAGGSPIVLLFFKGRPLVSLVLSLLFLLCILFFPAPSFSVSPSTCIGFTLLSFLQFLKDVRSLFSNTITQVCPCPSRPRPVHPTAVSSSVLHACFLRDVLWAQGAFGSVLLNCPMFQDVAVVSLLPSSGSCVLLASGHLFPFGHPMALPLPSPASTTCSRSSRDILVNVRHMHTSGIEASTSSGCLIVVVLLQFCGL